jgi:prepilin-type N-terminal cleavage/methylation domain-containing protein
LLIPRAAHEAPLRQINKSSKNMKIHIQQSARTLRAFTLIELLVVIAIIAILAGMAMPAMQQAMMAGRQTRAISDGKQIALALRLYANDNDGSFPSEATEPNESITTSNDAFRVLFSGYLDTESIFAVAGSKAGPRADNQMDTPAQILARGENHWAYISGLGSSSNSNWPVIVDHTDGAGYYNKTENSLGGTWKGGKAIVIRTDASAAASRLEGVANKRFLPRYNDKKLNALQVRDYMGDGVKLLEPAS